MIPIFVEDDQIDFAVTAVSVQMYVVFFCVNTLALLKVDNGQIHSWNL